jgi:hypothetical protein
VDPNMGISEHSTDFWRKRKAAIPGVYQLYSNKLYCVIYPCFFGGAVTQGRVVEVVGRWLACSQLSGSITRSCGACHMCSFLGRNDVVNSST